MNVYLFNFEHWSMTVRVNNVEGYYSRGGKGWISFVFSLKNDFILLYFLKHVKDDIEKRNFSAQFWSLFGRSQGIDKSHVIVKTSCQRELCQSVVHLLYANLRFPWFLWKHGNYYFRVRIVFLVSVCNWHLHRQETLGNKDDEHQ